MRKTKPEILKGTEDLKIKSSKFIANNTIEITLLNDTKIIRLHNTNIVTFATDGKIILNSGNWRTLTTKQRINSFIGDYNLAIVQRNYSWKLTKYSTSSYCIIKETSFFDGMIIDTNNDCKIINLVNNPHKKMSNQSINNLKKKIKAYCNILDKIDIPLPSNGDCWHCLFREEKTQIPLGDYQKDNSHLLMHLEDNYIHGSILINAMREAGYRDNQISIHYQMKWKDSFKRALYKYMVKRLILNNTNSL